MKRKGVTVSEELCRDVAHDWNEISGWVQEKSKRRVLMWLYSFPRNMRILCGRTCLDGFHEDVLVMTIMIDGVGRSYIVKDIGDTYLKQYANEVSHLLQCFEVAIQLLDR
jgi:hypothetical protein